MPDASPVAPIDAYVRLTRPGRPPVLYRTPARPDALLFVDLDCRAADAPATVQRLRELPHGHFIGVSTVVVRSPLSGSDPDEAELRGELQSELDRLFDGGSGVQAGVSRWGVLVGQVGVSFQMTWRAGLEDQPDDLIMRRARAAEIASMLTVNHAVWRPGDYHFKLPNGDHVGSFVRVADALSGPRDAAVLAFWLQPDLADGRGIVFDNRSLTPVAVAVQRLFDQQGVEAGPIALLEHYPEAQTDVERAVREAALEGGGVLAVLSVSSGGRTRDSLIAALRNAGQPWWRLHVVLDRSLSPMDTAPGREQPEMCSWLGFSNASDQPRPGSECALCPTSERHRVVAIDPRFFDGMILPDPTLIMLDPGRAVASSPLWTACDRAGAVALEHPPGDESRGRRGRADGQRSSMGVFVGMDRLVASDDFAGRVRVSFDALLRRRKGQREQSTAAEALRAIDRIVVASEDQQRQGFAQLVGTIRGLLPEPDSACTVVVVDTTKPVDEWGANERDAIVSAKRVLILVAATVTGYTLQRLLVGCQEVHRTAGADPDPLAGLVIHARTATVREWETLQNSFGQQLYAVYETPLPSLSPIVDEADLVQATLATIEVIPANWQPSIASFLEGRLKLARLDDPIDADTAAPYRPLLWGMPTDGEDVRARIRQHSLFGERLQPAALLAAVGSAVHHAREQWHASAGPTWQLFEMPALLRSYYDPLIIAAMLRWMAPGEIWWGGTDNAAREAVQSVLGRTSDPGDLPVLVAELLLAAAEGKVPPVAIAVAEAQALAILADGSAYPMDGVIAVAAAIASWHVQNLRRDATTGPRPELTLPPLPS